MFNDPVVYVDIETTGISATKAKIIEIGAIRVDNGLVSEYKTLVNPGSNLPHYISKITGIQDSDLSGAPYFDEIADELNSFLSGAVFIAHNVRFDYSFIKRQLESCGYKFRPKMICTVRLSRALYPAASGHSLEKLISRHQIEVSSRHRAYDDAKAIKDFSELAYAQHGAEAFAAAIHLQDRAQTLPPNLNQSELNEIKDTPGVYVYEDENGMPLYVGKSKKLRTRLQSHFYNDIASTKEMKLSQSVHHIRTIETSSELEALLMESKMVKELLPIHNRQLRRQRELSVLTKYVDQLGYINLKLENVKHLEPEMIDSVYGVYTSSRKAKSALEIKLRTFNLCPKLLGLERTNRGCFLSALGKCNGACKGNEAPETYNSRLETAMQRSKIEAWPYSGPIKIKQDSNSCLIVDKWIIVGKIVGPSGKLKPLPALFDIDTYRILRSFVSQNASSPMIGFS
jgi:DNA polymerase-3 subunit epsilon